MEQPNCNRTVWQIQLGSFWNCNAFSLCYIAGAFCQQKPISSFSMVLYIYYYNINGINRKLDQCASERIAPRNDGERKRNRRQTKREKSTNCCLFWRWVDKFEFREKKTVRFIRNWKINLFRLI